MLQCVCVCVCVCVLPFWLTTTEKIRAGMKHTRRCTIPQHVHTDMRMTVTMNVAGLGFSVGKLSCCGAGAGWLVTTTFCVHDKKQISITPQTKTFIATFLPNKPIGLKV